MLSAFLCGTLGCAIGLWLGTQVLGLSPASSLRMLVAANVSGIVSVLTITNIQWVPAVKRLFLTNIKKTWVVFLAMSVGIAYALSPPDVSLKAFAWMLGPMFLSGGYCIIIFGPIQDRIVRYRQRKQRRREQLHTAG
jgi:hypothetical protein